MTLDKCFVYQNTLYVREVDKGDGIDYPKSIEVIFTDRRDEALTINPETEEVDLYNTRKMLADRGYLGRQVTERDYNPYGYLNAPNRCVIIDCYTGKEMSYAKFSEFIKAVKKFEAEGRTVIDSEIDTDAGPLTIAEILVKGEREVSG